MSEEYNPKYEKMMNEFILKKYDPTERDNIKQKVYVLNNYTKEKDIRDRDLLQRFCQYVYDNLKGFSEIIEFARKYNVKLEKKKSIRFVPQAKIHKITPLRSREGERQRLREKTKPRQKNHDPKKTFSPTMSPEMLTENITINILPYQIEPINLKLSNNSKPLNSINFTLNDILNNPHILNKYSS